MFSLALFGRAGPARAAIRWGFCRRDRASLGGRLGRSGPPVRYWPFARPRLESARGDLRSVVGGGGGRGGRRGALDAQSRGALGAGPGPTGRYPDLGARPARDARVENGTATPVPAANQPCHRRAAGADEPRAARSRSRGRSLLVPPACDRPAEALETRPRCGVSSQRPPSLARQGVRRARSPRPPPPSSLLLPPCRLTSPPLLCSLLSSLSPPFPSSLFSSPSLHPSYPSSPSSPFPRRPPNPLASLSSPLRAPLSSPPASAAPSRPAPTVEGRVGREAEDDSEPTQGAADRDSGALVPEPGCTRAHTRDPRPASERHLASRRRDPGSGIAVWTETLRRRCLVTTTTVASRRPEPIIPGL